MRLRVQAAPLVYTTVCLVLGWTILTAIRVTLTTRYSLERVRVEDGANKLVDTWDALEENFRRREAAWRASLTRDPLWPVTVARTERQAAAVRSSTGTPEPHAVTVVRAKTPPAPPPIVLPRVLAVLFDREARALVHHDGANRLVRTGDRLGPLTVTRVAREGVTVNVNGTLRLLRVR